MHTLCFAVSHDCFTAIRCMTLFWLVFILLVSTAYRSKIVAFLVFPEMEELPKTLDALANSRFTIGLQYIEGVAHQYLNSSSSPVHQKLFKRLELETDDLTCIQKTMSEKLKYSCILYSLTVEYRLHRNISDKVGQIPLVMSPDYIMHIYHGFVTTKRAIFLSKLSNLVHDTEATGLVKKYWRLDREFIRKERIDWQKRENLSFPQYFVTGSNVLTLAHVKGPCLILGVGWGAAIFAFGIQILSFCWNKSLQPSFNGKSSVKCSIEA